MGRGFIDVRQNLATPAPQSGCIDPARIEAETEASLQPLLPEGAISGARCIQRNDADLLSPTERAGIGAAVPKVLNASGAARAVARRLMNTLGLPPAEIRRGPRRAPIWPAGLVGSLSHCERIAVAAIARSEDFVGLGIDIEPSEGIEPELARMVLTPHEAELVGDNPQIAHACFAIKEAVYKAVFPSDGLFLDFHDVELDFQSGTATTSYGRTVAWSCGLSASILTVAWIVRED
ncbi:4'-phosphopantetheinyl transferase family protein [Roseibium album]|uniref:4'-phosphopantetheinyl transferase family protein n=1 Tax=Roseibium album TaxID=311410 RepID=UPI0024922D28|nr:4'-phosphopantetheinyl transferase superfamily protein [Roseibium album]